MTTQLNARFVVTVLAILLALGLAGLVTLAYPQQAHYLVLLISLGLLTYGVYKLWTAHNRAHWPRVTATLKTVNEESYTVVESQYGPPRKYVFPVVEYEYELSGSKHQSNQVASDIKDIAVPEMDAWGQPSPDSMMFWRSWAAGYTIPAYVNPENKDEAVLVPQLNRERRSHFIALIIGGLLLLAVWCVLLFMLSPALG